MTPNTARRRKPAPDTENAAEALPENAAEALPEIVENAVEAAVGSPAPEAAPAPAPKKTAKPATGKKPKPKPKKPAKKPKPTVSETKAKLAEAATAKLDPLAHEINVRIEKAETLEKNADDHRISAIQQLGEAEKFCKLAQVDFKGWCKENVKWSPETIRKMLPIAKAKDPVLALEQWRNGVKAASATHRARKKAGTAPRASKKDAQPVALIEHIQAAQPQEQIALISKAAKDLGMAVVSETDRRKLEQSRDAEAFEKPVGEHAPIEKPAPAVSALQGVMDAFDKLKAGDKMKLVNYACEQIGGRLTFANFDAADPSPAEEKPSAN